MLPCSQKPGDEGDAVAWEVYDRAQAGVEHLITLHLAEVSWQSLRGPLCAWLSDQPTGARCLTLMPHAPSCTAGHRGVICLVRNAPSSSPLPRPIMESPAFVLAPATMLDHLTRALDMGRRGEPKDDNHQDDPARWPAPSSFFPQGLLHHRSAAHAWLPGWVAARIVLTEARRGLFSGELGTVSEKLQMAFGLLIGATGLDPDELWPRIRQTLIARTENLLLNDEGPEALDDATLSALTDIELDHQKVSTPSNSTHTHATLLRAHASHPRRTALAHRRR